MQIIRYAKRDGAYLDRAPDVSMRPSPITSGHGGFLTKPEGAGYGVAGERLFGKDADEGGDQRGIGIAVRKRDKELTEAEPGTRRDPAPTASTMRSRKYFPDGHLRQLTMPGCGQTSAALQLPPARARSLDRERARSANRCAMDA